MLKRKIKFKNIKVPFKNLNDRKEIVDEFLCIICLNLVNSPKICSNCDKLFCEDCLEKWFDVNSTDKCANCLDKFVAAKIQRIIIEILNKFEINCPAIPCSSKISNENLNNHLKNDCEYFEKEAKCK